MSIRHIKAINRPNEIDIIIPAAGLGRRMKSYGPKSLIKIADNETILSRQLKILKATIPNSNIILVCGFEANRLMNKSPDDIIKIENERYQETNVARSIGMGLRASSKDVLVVHGDLIFNQACIEELNLNRSSTVIGTDIMGKGEVGCVHNNNRLESMMFDLEPRWSQITFFTGRELASLKKICWNRENDLLFGFEVINKIISAGGKIKTVTAKNAKVIDIDMSKDILKVKDIV